jgi:hypothetical protein
MEKAARLYQELDGKVEAFGVGGADLGVMVDQKWYPLYSVQKMVRFIQKTPVVDGTGMKNTLEYQIAPFIESRIGEYVHALGRKAFIATGSDRWGLGQGFLKGGYEVTFGDLMFSLGIPIPLHTARGLKILAALIMPIAGRLPFQWVYPIGKEQEKRIPKWEKYYQWATVVAGDCHYIKRHIPEQLKGKVIATNTTTPADVDLFRQAGVKYLVTSTPVFEGRSFGTNMLEAALVAVAGKGRKLTNAELSQLIEQLGLEPQLQEL